MFLYYSLNIIEKLFRVTTGQLLTNYFGLSFYLNEDDYNLVVIIVGTKDLDHGICYDTIINNLISLHKIAWERKISTVVVSLRKT